MCFCRSCSVGSSLIFSRDRLLQFSELLLRLTEKLETKEKKPQPIQTRLKDLYALMFPSVPVSSPHALLPHMRDTRCTHTHAYAHIRRFPNTHEKRQSPTSGVHSPRFPPFFLELTGLIFFPLFFFFFLLWTAPADAEADEEACLVAAQAVERVAGVQRVAVLGDQSPRSLVSLSRCCGLDLLAGNKRFREPNRESY